MSNRTISFLCLLLLSSPLLAQTAANSPSQNITEYKQMQISIILKGNITPGRQETLRSLVTTLQKDFVLREEGCEEYAFYIDGQNFVLLERWANQEALDKHTKTKHFSEFIPKMKNQVEGGTFSAEIIKASERSFVNL